MISKKERDPIMIEIRKKRSPHFILGESEKVNLIEKVIACCKRIEKLLTSVDDRLSRKREGKE